MKTQQFAPKPLHDILLQSVHDYYFLTIEQLTRLNYSIKSLTYVREKVKELVDAGFLIRCFAPRATQAGATPSILFLAKKGINYLQTQGIDTTDRARLSEKYEMERNYHFIWHTLAVNDVLIAAELLSHHRPHYHLETMLHERTLKLWKLPVIPDGWLDFHLTQTQDRVCIWLEVDRGTIEERPFKRKLRKTVTYITSDDYAADFGASSCVIAFAIVKGGENRLKRLLAWACAELVLVEDMPVICLFTVLGQDEAEPNKLAPIHPLRLFRKPIWHSPSDGELVSLL